MLPIDGYLDYISSVVLDNQIVLLRATPGSGKTTRVPDYLNQKLGLRILVLEPRRVAALSAAEFISQRRAQVVGNEVGYQVRFESARSSSTKILFITEALLLKFLKDDLSLKNFDCIILDEFHERSLYTDFSLGLIKKTIKLRPELRIIIMSATLDNHELKSFFLNLVTLDIPGVIYPLELRYDSKPQLLRIDHYWYERLEHLVLRAIEEFPTESILLFVPGRGECEKLQKNLVNNQLVKRAVFVLHGQLKLSQQRRIFDSDSELKIIISTNVAESAVTVPGVAVVIDSGLERSANYDEESQLNQLKVRRISLASHRQRAGRAARLSPGRAYLAWMKADELSMRPDIEPEILSVDLRSVSLWLFHFEIYDYRSFSWLTPPKVERFERAHQFLQNAKMVSLDNHLTPFGSLVSDLPFEFSESYLVALASNGPNPLKLVIFSVFVVEFQKVIKRHSDVGRTQIIDHNENDLVKDFGILLSDAFLFQSYIKVLNQACKILQLKDSVPNDKFYFKNLADQFGEIRLNFLEIYLQAYPFRLAAIREASRNKLILANGKGAVLTGERFDLKSKFLICLDLSVIENEVQVRKVLPISERDLDQFGKRLFLERSEEIFDLNLNQKLRLEQVFFQKLLIKERRVYLGAADKGMLINRIIQNAKEFLKRSVGLAHDLERWQYWCARQNHDSLMPMLFEILIEEAFKEVNEEERLFYLDWEPYFFKVIEYPILMKWKKECPKHIELPSRKKINLKYNNFDRSIECEVLLRDLFGVKEHPQILGVSLRIIILGPHHRPIQVSQDILSFWSRSYPEIRKEMRGRYPRQPWPEDPLNYKKSSSPHSIKES